MGSLEYDEREFRNLELDAIYTEFGKIRPGLAIDPHLSFEHQSALAAEGKSYAEYRAPRGGRKACYAPRSLEEMDQERIKALMRTVEAERPDWLEQVRLATHIDNDTYRIISYSGVPPYATVAILRNMVERGEL